MTDAWLLVKRDLYYMPDGMGYTGIRDHAGRYSEAEAKKHAHDAGKNGNSVTMVRLSEAPEFSKGCWDDVARAHLSRQRDQMKSALFQVVRHWNEFGPEHGFEETIHMAERVLREQQ